MSNQWFPPDDKMAEMAKSEEQPLTADCEKTGNSEPVSRKDSGIDGAVDLLEQPATPNDDLPDGELNFPNGTWTRGNSQQSTPPPTPKRSVVLPPSDWMDQIDCNGELKEKRERAKQTRISGGSYRATFQPTPNRQERYCVSEKYYCQHIKSQTTFILTQAHGNKRRYSYVYLYDCYSRRNVQTLEKTWRVSLLAIEVKLATRRC